MPWRARLTQTALHAGARVMLEVLPAPVAAFSAGVELPLAARFDLQLSALASMRAETELAPATVRTQLLGAELVGCAHAASLPYLYGCLGLSGGAVRAAGDGYAQDRATTLAWLAGLARAAFRLSLTALTALQLTAGAHVNVFRPELLLLGSERTELSAVAGGSFGLDVIVAFE